MNQLKKWSSHSLDNLSICLICASEKFSGVFNEIRTHDLCDATQVNLLGSCFRNRCTYETIAEIAQHVW